MINIKHQKNGVNLNTDTELLSPLFFNRSLIIYLIETTIMILDTLL